MFGDEPSIDAGALFDLGINPEDAKAIDDEGKKNNHKCKNK